MAKEPLPMENEPLSSADRVSPEYFEAIPLAGAVDTFYSGAGRGDAVEQLLHFLRFTDSILLLTGKDGSGRTELLHVLVAQMQDWFVFQLEGSRPDAEHALEALFAEMDHSVERPQLLLIDDAHLLGEAVLGLAFDYQAANGEQAGRLHLLLAGDETLAAQVGALSSENEFLHQIGLSPLSRSEISEYIELKLGAMHWKGAVPFSAVEQDELLSQSDGRPGKLDQLLQAKIAGQLGELPQGAPEPAPGLPTAHMVMLVVLITGLAMAFFYRDSWLTGARDSVALGEMEAAQSPVVKQAAQTEMNRKQFVEQEDFIAVEVLEPDEETAPNTDVQMPLLAEKSSATDFAKELLEQNVLSKEQPLEPETKSAELLNQEAIDKSREGLIKKEVRAELGHEGEDSPLSALILSELTHAEAYLLSLPEEAFVLQVLSAASKVSVEAFVAKQENRKDLYIYTAKRSGRDWYIVVTGGYDSLAEAKAQLSRLPATQKKLGPWPRSVAAIQHSIREYRDI